MEPIIIEHKKQAASRLPLSPTSRTTHTPAISSPQSPNLPTPPISPLATTSPSSVVFSSKSRQSFFSDA